MKIQKNINKGHENLSIMTKMKLSFRVFTILLFFVAISSSVYSLSASFDQDENTADFYTQQHGNTIFEVIPGSVDDVLFVDNGSSTLNYDYRLEITDSNEPFFIGIENFDERSNYTIAWKGDVSVDPTLYIRNVTMNEQGTYLFKFTPSSVDGESVVYIDLHEPGNIVYLEYTEQKPQGASSLIAGFVNAFVEVVEVNVQFWKVMFYGSIFLIVVLVLFGLIRISFELFSIAKKMRNEDNRNSIDEEYSQDNNRKGGE